MRGVAEDSKLLETTPWRHFTWMEGKDNELRQFDHGELLALPDNFAKEWPGLRFAPAFVKLSLWSWARRFEVSSLRWSDERRFIEECHFESNEKWGVTKWFRIPDGLRADLEAFRMKGNDFVFGSYPQQLRDFIPRQHDNRSAKRVRADFDPENLGGRMYRQIAKWSESLPNGSASLHVFRKTTLQYAVIAGNVEQEVADDASVSPSVLMTNHARLADQELRHKSNRMFQPIRSSLSLEVAIRHELREKFGDGLIEKLDQGRQRGDWDAVARLAEELNRMRRATG